MEPGEILLDFALRRYDPPFSEILRRGAIVDLTNPVHVILLILDFRTEVEMNGIANFIGNGTGEFAAETADALDVLGCHAEAATLREILARAAAAGMTHEAMQARMAGLEEFAVTTFGELHGEKWDELMVELNELADRIDLGAIGDKAEAFVGRHLAHFT